MELFFAADASTGRSLITCHSLHADSLQRDATCRLDGQTLCFIHMYGHIWIFEFYFSYILTYVYSIRLYLLLCVVGCHLVYSQQISLLGFKVQALKLSRYK